jgi:lysophospholipase L1-like esterase
MVFAELILRVKDGYVAVQAKADQQLYQDRPSEFSMTRHHRLIPGVRYRHKEQEYDYIWANNALGMRDRERSLKSNPRSFRILFLGDSMVQGYGVPLEHSMVYRLEDILNDPPRKTPIEVLNAGIFGYSPLLEYLYLRELMPTVDPDVVVVGFFLGNDVGDDYFYSKQAQINEDGSLFFEKENWPWDYRNEVLGITRDGDSEGPASVNLVQLLWLKGQLKSLLLKSHLVRTIQKAIHRQQQQRYAQEINTRINKLLDDRKDDIRINLGAINYPTTDRQKRMEYWEISKEYLTKIHSLCHQKGVPMVLVVISGKGFFNEPYEILDELGSDLSIPVIQLLPEFQVLAPERFEALFYEIDGHLNAEGNEFVANILNRELRSLNILPE